VKRPHEFRSKLKWKVEDFEYEVLLRTKKRVKKSDSKAVREAVEETVLREVSNEFWHELEKMRERIKQNILYSMHIVDKQIEENDWEMRLLFISSGRLLTNKEVKS
jgi:hypothetical protein